MLVGTDDGEINHGVFVVMIFGKTFEHLLPDAAFAPTHVPRVDDQEIHEPLRKIQPRDATLYR